MTMHLRYLMFALALGAAPARAQAPDIPLPLPMPDLAKVPSSADRVEAALAGRMEAAGAPTGPTLYSLHATRQDIESILTEFAHRSGASMSIPDLPEHLVSIHFNNMPLEEALKRILFAGHLDYRKVDDTYVIDYPMDLKVKFDKDAKTLDVSYRCRRVGAASLADAVGKLVPDIKITPGPIFLSPSLDNGGASGGGDQVRAMSSTDVSFRTHDVAFSGPAESVRRALAIAQRFDRPRRQVRIGIRILEISRDAARELGIAWENKLPLVAKENGDSGDLVNGIRLGHFSHQALQVSAELRALESSGRTKTLSNPTILLLDGERSFILSGQRYFYPEFKGKDQNGQSIYSVSETKIGVYLQVGVQIGMDNDMVLSLYPQVTSLGPTRTVNGGDYPTINTAEEQTTVKAMSGETLVMGGILLDGDTRTKSGFPLLGKIPLIGSLFSSTNKTQSKKELMIILTPELIHDPEPPLKIDLKIQPGNGI